MRSTTFGDVNVCHDLESADQCIGYRPGGAHDLVEHTVDPKPDPEVSLGWFDVDVRGAIGCCSGDQHIDQLDDGRLVGGCFHRPQIIGFDCILSSQLGHIGYRVVQRGHPRYGRFNIGSSSNLENHLAPGDGSDVVDRQHIGGIGHCYDQLLFFETNR